jgi:hypothetical protein
MSRSCIPTPLIDLSPEELRQWAIRARQWANQPNNGLMPKARQLLRRNATNLEKLAVDKARRYALQNRHPDHPTRQ